MNSIIQEAYQLFQPYKAVVPLDICTDCCMASNDANLLANLPVKEIPKNLLMEYNDGAATAKTPIDELKHFLPKYLELIWNFDFPSHSTEIALKRLAPFNLTEWTATELNFLERFALVFFNRCLSIYPLPEEDIDSILIMFWRGQFQLTELLNSWQAETSLSSTLHFVDLYLEGFKRNPLKMSNSFGDETLAKELRTWLDDDKTQKIMKDKIEQIIMNESCSNDSQLNQLNLLYELLG